MAVVACADDSSEGGRRQRPKTSRTNLGRFAAFSVALAMLSVGCSPTGDTDVSSTLTVPVTTSSVPQGTTAGSSSSTTTGTTTTTTTLASTTSAASTTTTLPATTTSTPKVAAAVVTRVSTSEQVVALTFDAGSDRGFAAEILDTLAAHSIKASFGMTGKWAESNPDLVRRMIEEGHALINHTYDHPHMETLSTDQRLSQLARAEEIVKALAH